ncbi:MAG: sigma-70 family RNA polymerase sigma factor, partial [Actinomycetota bacterium]|nr:sigma-70 family RNA polymerase sigma factor [Actinomycetota bacterium]
LIDEHHAAMIRIACLYVRDRAAAEDVVQETWLAVVRGIDRFDGRSTLKTWLYRILTNRAKTAGQRQSRLTPVAIGGQDGDGAAVDPSRFLPGDDSRWPGHWSTPPVTWPAELEDRAVAGELMDLVAIAIARLPRSQAMVITLRDVECWSSKEVCNVMGLTETNQRVLLHRARSEVRQALEDYHEPARLR